MFFLLRYNKMSFAENVRAVRKGRGELWEAIVGTNHFDDRGFTTLDK